MLAEVDVDTSSKPNCDRFGPKRFWICPRVSRSANFRVTFSTAVCIVLRGRKRPLSQLPANAFKSFISVAPGAGFASLAMDGG